MTQTRWILLIAILMGAIALVAAILFYGFQSTFGIWRLQPPNVPLLDIRLITDSARSYAAGYDPAIYNPGDPTGRIFNYPKIWYLALASGLDDRWTVPLAVAMIALFLGSVVLFPGRLTGLSTALILAAVFSSATILGIARANVELFIFTLMIVSLVLVGGSAPSAFGIMLLAILLKIIPVLGVGGLLGKDRVTSLRLVLGAVLFTVLYFVITLRDMLFTFNTTQRGITGAYGATVLPYLIDQIVHDHVIREGPLVFYKVVTRMQALFLNFPALPYVAALLIVIGFVWLGLRHRISSDETDLRNQRAFWMGAGMYIGSFLIGNNWDYRLVFLILTLPQLADWATHKDRSCRPTAIFSLLMLFASMWYSLINAAMAGTSVVGLYLAELLTTTANWALFAVLIYLLVASLPDWAFQPPRALIAQLLPGR